MILEKKILNIYFLKAPSPAQYRLWRIGRCRLWRTLGCHSRCINCVCTPPRPILREGYTYIYSSRR